MAPAASSQAASDAAERRIRILSSLAAQPSCTRAEARAAGAALGLSERQIYNWVRKLRGDGGHLGEVARRGSRTTKGLTRLPREQEAHLGRIIAEEMAGRQDGAVDGLFAAIVKRCAREMSPAPSASTVFRRLRARLEHLSPRPAPPRDAVDETPGLLRGRLPQVSAEDLLSPLYGTLGNPAGWRGFLDALSHAYGGAMSGITMHDYARGLGFADASTGLDRAYEASYARHFSRLNPWIGAAERREVGFATLSDSLFPYADLLRTEFYNDWWRPQRIGGGLGVTVERNGRRVMAVTVLMPRPTIEQDALAVSRLQALTPHLLWVSRLQRQFTTLEARLAAAEGALDRLATAMLVLQGTGRVLYLNAMAERLVAPADGLVLRGGRLEVAASGERETLQRLIAQALRDSPDLAAAPGGVCRISRPSGRPAFEVLVAPISDSAVRLGVTGRLAAVFIRDPVARMVTPVEWIQTIFGLTQAEARLMQALLAGERVETLQGRWTLGRETLRTQLKSVFHKTGVNRQSDLIRLGLRSVTAMYR
jgi:DNA-binding CsgD family transcriptional regulator/PAS domain-containing protein